MNTHPAIRPHSPFRSFWIAVFVVPLALGIAGILYLASFFIVSGETRALRNAMLEGNRSEYKRIVEVNTGRLPLAAARFGLGFLNDIPPEARQMMASLRKGEVSVYKSRHHQKPDGTKLLENTDRAMDQRGWYRLAGVFWEGRFVAVYLKDAPESERMANVCVAVLDRENLVCASATAEWEPLIELVREKTGRDLLGPIALR
jgi:hypothetical protein